MEKMSLEVVELVVVECNLVDNQFQQKFEVLYMLLFPVTLMVIC